MSHFKENGMDSTDNILMYHLFPILRNPLVMSVLFCVAEHYIYE